MILNDFESAGGTFVNSRKIHQQEIKPGDTIRIGETQLRYQDDDVAEASTMAPPTMARRMPSTRTCSRALSLTGGAP